MLDAKSASFLIGRSLKPDMRLSTPAAAGVNPPEPGWERAERPHKR